MSEGEVMDGRLTAEDLAKLVELEKAATPGPWLVRPREHDDWGWIRAEDGSLVAIGRAGTFAGDYDEHERYLRDCRAKGIDPYEHNAALIAAARNALPALLASAAAAQAMREALEKAERALVTATRAALADSDFDAQEIADMVNANPTIVAVRAAIEKATKP